MSRNASDVMLSQWNPSELRAATVEQFLYQLQKPSYILIDGLDTSRTRAVTTLLHGNEPSGVKAVFDCLSRELKPAVNILLIIVSIDAAMQKPLFTHRMLPGKPDINRCFKPPYQDEWGNLALSVLNTLKKFKPECLVDIHNTSGAGPAFAVSTNLSKAHQALTCLFASEMIYTDIQLGSLMEHADELCPTVTIECGGSNDERADRIARAGLERYWLSDSVLHYPHDDIRIYRQPVRVELLSGYRLVISDTLSDEDDIGLPLSIEALNERVIQVGEVIAYCGDQGLAALTAMDGKGNNIIQELFKIERHQIIAAKPLKIFMASTNEAIVKSDCLFYVTDFYLDGKF